MCTCGALSRYGPDGRLVSYLLKTSDSDFVPHWHGHVRDHRGRSFLAFGIVPQGGINAGINDAGLALMMSFLDYRGPREISEAAETGGAWWEDERGLINADLLSRCASVSEGMEFLFEAVRSRRPRIGGSHFLADPSGAIAVFEHCDGRMEGRLYPDGGVVARGNDGLLIWAEEQERLPPALREDRRARREVMARALAGLEASVSGGEGPDGLEKELKGILASHAPAGVDAIGSICAHGVGVPGGRWWSPAPNWTMSGIILDVAARRMIYSVGNPCAGRWRGLSFAEISA